MTTTPTDETNSAYAPEPWERAEWEAEAKAQALEPELGFWGQARILAAAIWGAVLRLAGRHS